MDRKDVKRNETTYLIVRKEDLCQEPLSTSREGPNSLLVKPGLELQRWSHCGINPILSGKPETHPKKILAVDVIRVS